MTDHPGNKATEKKLESGSPISGEPLSIGVGRIRRPHGVKGEVIFESYPEYPLTLKKGKVLLIGKRKEAFTIRSIRRMDQNYLIAFDGFEDCDVVSHLRNQIVYIDQAELKKREDGGNFPHEVLGMAVFDESGKSIGVLREVLLTGANDVYIVENSEQEEILLPAIDSVILNIDAEKKVMTVRLPIWE